MTKKVRLGVNVDHIATLRQARREAFPSPLEAAKECLAGGADGIVCHLREDRRHIQDQDVLDLKKLGCRLDLEMALTDEMVNFALKLKPEMITLVPEKREEITTEGGLDIKSQSSNPKIQTNLKSQISKLQKSGIVVSLFIDPEEEQIRAAAESGAKYIEIHTGAFANLKTKKELVKIKAAAKLARQLGLGVNAGHGLDYNNVCEIMAISEIEELNIGFSIIARAVFVGLKKATQEMLIAMRKG